MEVTIASADADVEVTISDNNSYNPEVLADWLLKASETFLVLVRCVAEREKEAET